jgi:hypothetical protein
LLTTYPYYGFWPFRAGGQKGKKGITIYRGVSHLFGGCMKGDIKKERIYPKNENKKTIMEQSHNSLIAP